MGQREQPQGRATLGPVLRTVPERVAGELPWNQATGPFASCASLVRSRPLPAGQSRPRGWGVSGPARPLCPQGGIHSGRCDKQAEAEVICPGSGNNNLIRPAGSRLPCISLGATWGLLSGGCLLSPCSQCREGGFSVACLCPAGPAQHLAQSHLANAGGIRRPVFLPRYHFEFGVRDSETTGGDPWFPV